jgi:hypothetical protein
MEPHHLQMGVFGCVVEMKVYAMLGLKPIFTAE